MCCAVTALEAAEVLQSVVETAAMVAPPCQLRMQIRGLSQPPSDSDGAAAALRDNEIQMSAR